MTDSRGSIPMVLATSRIVLRPFALTDVSAVFRMSQEAGMRTFIPDQVYRDEAEAESVIQDLIAAATPPDPQERPCVLGVEETETGQLIGHVGLSPARDSVEVGYAIADAWQGEGYATEAVTAIVTWALAEVGLSEVLGIVDFENHASRRVLEKSGFEMVGDEARAASGGPGRRLVYRRGGKTGSGLASCHFPR